MSEFDKTLARIAREDAEELEDKIATLKIECESWREGAERDRAEIAALKAERVAIVQMLRGLAIGLGGRGKKLTREHMMEAAATMLKLMGESVGYKKEDL